MRNRAGNFSVGRLMEFLTALGQDVRITVKPTRKAVGRWKWWGGEGIVARIERSEMRGRPKIPDFASLHPGYACSEPGRVHMARRPYRKRRR